MLNIMQESSPTVKHGFFCKEPGEKYLKHVNDFESEVLTFKSTVGN